MGDRWWQHQRNPKIVLGNKFFTVPKTAKTDRGACKEPTLNLYVQRGIGAYIRKRLKRFGINLNDQTINQQLAKEAYASKLATIDLSRASDSVARLLISDLFPSRWYQLLELARSPTTTYRDSKGKLQTIKLEKLSSMGNGYTFEVESLLFAAIVFSIVPRDQLHQVHVYGDDIIVPQVCANEVVDTLDFLGFSVNKEKSFLAGNFFESCGTDWFKGQPVRPFYLRQQEESFLPYEMQIANSVRLYAQQVYAGGFCDPVFRPLWLDLYKSTPKDLRKIKVPPSLGDSGFITSRDEANPPSSFKIDGSEGYSLRVLNVKPARRFNSSYGFLLSRLHMTHLGADVSPIQHTIFSPLAIKQLWATRRWLEVRSDSLSKNRETLRGLYGRLSTTRVGSVPWSDTDLLWGPG